MNTIIVVTHYVIIPYVAVSRWASVGKRDVYSHANVFNRAGLFVHVATKVKSLLFTLYSCSSGLHSTRSPVYFSVVRCFHVLTIY